MSPLLDPIPEAQVVTVFGLGWTGVAAANLLRRLGKRVIATDTRDGQALERALEALATQQGIALDPEVERRPGTPHHHHEGQAVILTQSVRFHEPCIKAAQDAGVPVIPEVALAAGTLDPARVTLVAIAGTDGKTTTTKLTHHLAAGQRRAFVGGNSWTPLSAVVCEVIDALEADPLPEGQRAVLVAEVSAFQIPPWHTFAPQVAAVTNVAEDHVDEFFQGSMEAYTAAKRGVTDQLGPGGVAVLNMDDPRVRTWEEGLRLRGARVVRVSLSSRAVGDHPDAAYRQNGQLRLRWGGQDHALIDQDTLRLVGDHNVENVLTATGALLPLGLDLNALRRDLDTFVAPGHRLQHVAELDQVAIYDDSKATNVHASLAGLAAFGSRPLVAIVGGVDKGLDLDHWVEVLRARTRRVVVIGQLRERLLRDHAHRLPQAIPADSLDEALTLALEAARPGDALVLSPACSSFDMFSSYAERGQVFQALVRQRLG